MPYRRQELTGSAPALLDAVVAISSEADLPSVLSRIVESACLLTDARYGALGVLGPDGDLADLITYGLDRESSDITEFPHGRGILRLLIDAPEPLRLEDLTTHPHRVGFPAGHPEMRSFLGVPVRLRGWIFGNLYLAEKADGTFTEDDELLVVALAAAAAHVVDRARDFDVSERSRQWLQASTDLVAALQPPLEMHTALTRIATTAAEVSEGSGAAVVRMPHGGDDAVVAGDDVEGSRALLSQSLAELGQLTRPAEWEHPQGRLQLVPLDAHAASDLALVTFHGPDHPVLVVEERELLARFAGQAALALDRAEAVAQQATLAVLSDRERIARDLHDTAIQRLFAAGLALQGLSASLDPDRADQHERVDHLIDELDHVVRDVRGTIAALRQGLDTSLTTAVRALAREYATSLGFTPTVHTLGPVDAVVSDTVADELLPVLREALSNVSRHAGATAAWIYLTVDPLDSATPGVTLHVEDDGVGAQPGSRSSGLQNVWQRAVSLGGTSRLLPRDPHGTVFAWRVPI
ncbi:GAF domain-containing sensor histidine kinase [Nocardioides acrostichi]|uniref:GAF domain-containing protein n=1 Tax=Nocardioides acrostichi TaxID=2784339 RepID=A0A930UXV8_9ACTN|nr:GAF domain-containing protein [Nocardioides acrostichi]MBF4162888.1 GAF domain-containing protein [Nocardioides acrostichi]